MYSLGIEDDAEIRRFVDPQYWLSYFPPHAKHDLEMMGLKVSIFLFIFFLKTILIECSKQQK